MVERPTGSSVAVCIASWNTRDLTELCIRTAVARAGRRATFVVGDGGSTDGSIEMLTELDRRGTITLERAEGGRHHHAWLDHWVRTRPEEYLVFSDSDMYFARRGWLTALVDTADATGADIVCGEFLEEIPGYVEPVGGKNVRLRSRAAPWLMLVRRATVERVGTSFDYVFVEDDSVPEGLVGFDVAGAVFHSVLEHGGTAVVMPAAHRRTWLHFGGASWRKVGGKRAIAAQVLVRTELPLRRLLGGAR